MREREKQTTRFFFFACLTKSDQISLTESTVGL